VGEDFAEPPAAGQADQGGFEAAGDALVFAEVAAVDCHLTHRGGTLLHDGEEVGQHGCVGGLVVEDAQRLVEDGFFDVAGGLFTQDGEQGADHGEAPGVGVGFDFLGLFFVACVTEPAGCVFGFAGVEDVEVAAASSEGDDLSAEGGDHVDVVGFQVAEHDREDAVSGESGGHPAYGGGLAEAREAEEEDAGVADQFRALEPADGVAA